MLAVLREREGKDLRDESGFAQPKGDVDEVKGDPRHLYGPTGLVFIFGVDRVIVYDFSYHQKMPRHILWNTII